MVAVAVFSLESGISRICQYPVIGLGADLYTHPYLLQQVLHPWQGGGIKFRYHIEFAEIDTEVHHPVWLKDEDSGAPPLIVGHLYDYQS